MLIFKWNIPGNRIKLNDMKFKTITDYTETEFDTLLRQVPSSLEFEVRVEKFCLLLEGRAYQQSPLIGGPGEKEFLVIYLKKFDCVTFVETVTAFCSSSSRTEFENNIRNIRYQGGVVDYYKRNHYMSDWMKYNVEAGYLEKVKFPGAESTFEKNLSVLSSIPAHRIDVKGYPPGQVLEYSESIKSGDIISFISSEKRLDYFHVGILIKNNVQPTLFHASKSMGKVIIEPLKGFFEKRALPGVTLVRPIIKIPEENRK